MQDDLQFNVNELAAEQESSVEAFQADQQAEAPIIIKFQKSEKTLKPHKTRLAETTKAGEKGERAETQQHLKNSADQYQRKNPELKASVLVLLRERVKPDDTPEDILKKLAEFYPDVSLADEALEFLLENSEGELNQNILKAKANHTEQNGREITAGRNIGAQAREAAEKGLGTATSLRDLYRNITGTPRDSNTLFQELSQRYAFKDLKKVVDFLLHSLGADMKSKGPSIPHGQLHRLLTETRSLQAILGVYRFFRGRMELVDKLFAKEGLSRPPQLTFETLARQFMALAGERYITGDKVKQSSTRLGIDKWIMAKIIALSQLRDAVREVAVNQVYRSLQHRDELYMAILEALEDLEDELEELLERQEQEEGGGGGKGEEQSEEEQKKKEGKSQ